MNSQTSLVAEQVRLRQWAAQIQECQSRPSDMKVETWCNEHGITKANYYYRLRRVRKACLEACNPEPAFVELPIPAALPTAMPSADSCDVKPARVTCGYTVPVTCIRKSRSFFMNTRGPEMHPIHENS